MQKALNRIGRNAGIAGIGLVVKGVVNYLASVLLSRALGASAFGIYTLAFVIVYLAGLLSTLGMQLGAFKYVSQYISLDEHGKARAAVRFFTLTTATLGPVFGIVLYLLSDWLALQVFNKPDLGQALQIVAFAAPLMGLMSVLLSTLQGLQLIPTQALIENIAQPVFKIVLFGLALLLGFRLGGVLWALVAATLLTTLWAALEVWRKLPRDGDPWKIEGENVREWVSFSLPVFLESILLFFMMQTGIEVLLLGRMVDEVQVGIYGAVYRLLPVIVLPALAFNYAFGPVIAEKSADHDTRAVNDYFQIISRWVALGTIPIFLCLFLFSSQVLGFFGSEYTAGALSLIVLSIGFLLTAPFRDVRVILMVNGKEWLYLLNSMLLIVITVGLSFWLIPRMGILGAAIAGASARICYNALGLLEVFFLFDIHPFGTDAYKPWLAGAVVLGIYYGVQTLIPAGITGSIYFVVLASAIIMGLYLLAFIILKPSEADKAVFQTIRRKFSFKEVPRP
jgi:O-antigen/teichoic acid export membrane protein